MNSESTMELQKRRAARLWARLEEAFGNGRWKRLRGEVAPGVWLAGIAMLGNEEVRHGLKRLVTDWPGDADPPTWPQFRDLCRPRDGRTPEQRARDARIALEHDRHAALPSPEQLAATSPVGRRWLAYWITVGLRPRPPGMTDATLAEWLDGADVEAMRQIDEHGCNVILQQHGVEQDYRDWRAA